MFKKLNILTTVLFVLLMALQSSDVPAAPKTKDAAVNKKGVLSGRIVTKNEGPISNGQIIFFRVSSGPAPAPEKYERTPDFVREIGDDGKFDVVVPAGKYYLSAIKRASGETIGPAVAGDLVWRGLDKKGRPKVYAVKPGERLDIGTIEDVVILKAENIAKIAEGTAIMGIVIDTDGKPVSDAVVVAFLNPSLKSKPLFVSDKTGKDGKYLLRLTEGTYYLRVRNQFASGPPEPGQIVGFYGDATPAPISIKDGEIQQDINFKVVLFPGRGPLSGSTPGR